MVYGVWCMVYGVWCMVYGVWCMVYGVWCMVYGVWCMVYGFFFTECALIELKSKLRGHSAKQPTIPVKGSP